REEHGQREPVGKRRVVHGREIMPISGLRRFASQRFATLPRALPEQTLSSPSSIRPAAAARRWPTWFDEALLEAASLKERATLATSPRRAPARQIVDTGAIRQRRT